MTVKLGLGCGALLLILAITPRSDAAVEYQVKRIASGLNQPTYITQAPGDPANILYYTERTTNAVAGFNASNTMGKVWRYDTIARTRTLVLDLATRSVTQDTGLSSLAFSPDFNNPAAAGYQKLYIASSQSVTLGPTSGGPINRVEQYTVGATFAATFDRTILQYSNTGNAYNNHAIDWIGFNPTATGAARGYLYVTMGDGNFSLPNRPSQNPADVQGKILRVDVTPGLTSSYPGNPNKNFAIPADNPLPTYNTAHPGTPIAGLGEVYLTGLRNAYRASFDRATGDMYIGDVGESSAEELDFLKNGSNTSGPPVDFGWPQREGTANGITSPFASTNPNTGVTALNPIQSYVHVSGGNAIVGGYRYRGPIASLQGKYFYADFVTQALKTLDFDTNTNPATFNGNNGTVTDVTTLLNSLLTDPTGPVTGPIGHIASFGEDNAGNLYIIDFGPGSGFAGQYPGAGLGQIFELVPVPEPIGLILLTPLIVLLHRRRPRRAA